MRYWWVNQKQTHKEEIRGNFMWSPKQNADGTRSQYYDNMREMSVGDLVFSYWNGHIRAIGIVSGEADTAPKPDFGNAGLNWSDEGWYAQVDYRLLSNPISPKAHIEVLKSLLPAKYSPIRPNGLGNQMYLAEISSDFAETLRGLIGQDYFDALADIEAFLTAPEHEDVNGAVVDRTLVGATFRNQIVKARRGQGLFRSNVLLRETACRVTRVKESQHLTASHIKPWRDASDSERLDGANGLLLSPHIDHLFDAGYITFSSSQTLIIVPEVRETLLDAWGIDAGVRVGEFSTNQNAYLDYHRANVFKHGLLE